MERCAIFVGNMSSQWRRNRFLRKTKMVELVVNISGFSIFRRSMFPNFLYIKRFPTPEALTLSTHESPGCDRWNFSIKNYEPPRVPLLGSYLEQERNLPCPLWCLKRCKLPEILSTVLKCLKGIFPEKQHVFVSSKSERSAISNTLNREHCDICDTRLRSQPPRFWTSTFWGPLASALRSLLATPAQDVLKAKTRRIGRLEAWQLKPLNCPRLI